MTGHTSHTLEIEDSAAGVRTYLEAMVRMRSECNMPRPDGYAYGSVEEFVLKHGTAYSPLPLPPGIDQGQMKQCFNNARSLALQKTWLRYAEGYAIGHFLPVHHAWCVRDDGGVVDPTWPDPDRCAYYGVSFSTETMVRFAVVKGAASILDDFENRWPILQEPYDEGRFRERLHLLRIAQRRKR